MRKKIVCGMNVRNKDEIISLPKAIEAGNLIIALFRIPLSLDSKKL